jgi:zinc transport system substrate-binding protein
MSSAARYLERRDARPWRIGWQLVRLLVLIGLGVGLPTAIMLTGFGMHADRPLLGATSPTGSEIEPLETIAGIPPVAYLVQRIGGPYVRVEVLVQAGQDPHIFEPTPRQAIHLSRAKLFFRAGMPFEDRLVEHVAGEIAHFTVVDAAAGIAKRASNHTCDDACMVRNDDRDDDGPADPHVWLSPPLLKTMASNITAALGQADPLHKPIFETNLKMLDAELDALDRRIAQSLLPYRGQAFYVFHPAFGYFADSYGLRQESVEVEGKLPTPRQVFSLISKARADHVKIIFLQPQFNQQVAASIAQAIGGAVMPMDDLAFDVIANLDDVAQKIAAANRQKMQ